MMSDTDELPAMVASRESSIALRVVGVHKHFDGIAALSECSLDVRAGEIHALVGENGAGKSTLIKIVTGALSPDGGQFFIDGREAALRDTSDGHAAGIVALYQELAIVGSISVAENVFLGQHLPGVGGFVNYSRLNEAARTQLVALGQGFIDPSMPADRLSPIQQTMVAIARAVCVNAKVLILDEPTASLTDAEIPEMFAALRSLRDQGVAIVYVSHRLEEAFELCDRVSVMRNGVVAMTEEIAQTSVTDVITAMIGRPQEAQFPERSEVAGEVVLEVDDLAGGSVSALSLQLRAGEIVGVAGLAGSGRSQLLKLISGAQRRQSGRITVDGRERTIRTVEDGLRAGIALVPEERRSEGLFLRDDIETNISIASLAQLCRTPGFISPRKVRALAERSVADLAIKTSGYRQPVEELSGGNQQKVVLSKYLARAPRVLLLDEPTRGVDVGAKAEIYRIIRDLARSGSAVVIVSSELPEVIGATDRIIALRDGRAVGEVRSRVATQEQLLSMFYGRNAS